MTATSYLGAWVVAHLLDGDNDPGLERLVRRVGDPAWRALIEELGTTGVLDREESLAERLGMMDEGQTMAGAVAMVRKNLPHFDAAVAQRYPCPPGVDLESAAATFSATEWLWHLWVPRGYLTLLLGMSGVGKSQVALRLAQSALHAATPWPDGQASGHLNGNSRRICWLDTESRQALLAERAELWGMQRGAIIWPLDPQQPRSVTPAMLLDDERHWKLLADFLAEWQPALTVIDSLSGGHRMDENSADLRDVLLRLSDACRDLHLAIVLIHHLRKAQGEERPGVVELDRARGTSAIVQLAAQVLALDVPDPAQKHHLRLRVLKSNLATEPPALGVRIEDQGLTFGPAPGEPQQWSSLADARAFLLDYLQVHSRLAADVRAEAAARGVPWTAVERAKRELGVVVRRQADRGAPAGAGRWWWALRAQDLQPEPPAQPEHWSDR